jgi:DNA-binding MarR family transcriptional regulator
MSALNERMKQSNFQNAGHEAILSLMAAAFTVRDKLNYICQKKNVSVVQYNILRILKSIHPQGYSRNEISSRMLERAPDITRVINRMVKSGLVERIKSRQDMRQSIAKITSSGNTLLLELNTMVQAYQKEFQQKVSKNQCEVLSSICNEILRLNG